MVFNKKHKDLFLSFKELYYNNIDMFMELQDKIVVKGTEQTPLNYWIQSNNVELNTDLPLAFKFTHMHRKVLFGHNWQLNEDDTPFFIKYGYDWVFNGIPKDDRSKVMKQVWSVVKSNYVSSNKKVKNVLDEVSHKDTAKYTTSRKFKEDILKYFSNKKYKDMKILELGCCQGDGTKIYSEVFGKVYAVDNSQENIDKAKKVALEYSDIFPDRFYLEIQNHKIAEEEAARKVIIKLSNELNIPLVATNDCHYCREEHWEAHDVLFCLGTGKNRSDTNRIRYEPRQFYIKTADEMYHQFADTPKALENTISQHSQFLKMSHT